MPFVKVIRYKTTIDKNGNRVTTKTEDMEWQEPMKPPKGSKVDPPDVREPEPQSPSQDEPILFAIRFATCNSNTCEICWHKDRMWMSVEEGSRFDMHKEHADCNCRVQYFTNSEYWDWMNMYGMQEA